MALLVLALVGWIPWMPSGYALPKLLILSFVGLYFGNAREGTSYDKALISLWLMILASLMFSVDPYGSLVGRYNDWSHGVWAMALMTGFCLLGARSKDWHPLVPLAALLSIAALLERLHTGARALGPIGDPVGLGSFLALMTPLCVSKDRRHLIFLIPGLWATGSRGAWLGAGAGLLVLWWAREE